MEIRLLSRSSRVVIQADSIGKLIYIANNCAGFWSAVLGKAKSSTWKQEDAEWRPRDTRRGLVSLEQLWTPSLAQSEKTIFFPQSCFLFTIQADDMAAWVAWRLRG